MTIKRVPSLLTVMVLAALVALSTGAWWVIHNGVRRQDQALLKEETSQAVFVLQRDIQQISLGLGSVGVEANVFDKQAKTIRTASTITVALVTKGEVVDGHGDVAPGSPHVKVVVGPDLHQGEQLTGDLATIASAARSTLSGSRVIDVAGRPCVVFSIVPPSIALRGYVALEVSEIFPGRTAPTYHKLDIALYATPTPQPGQLLVSSIGRKPLPQPTASAELRVGALEWDTVGAATAPLLDSVAQATPWIVLGVGLLLALALSVTVETLTRRQRHTASVVAKREAELLEAQGEMVRHERLSAVGEMAAMMNHELRNPLGVITNCHFLIRSEVGAGLSPEVDTYLTHAEQATHRAVNLSDDLTAFAREHPPSVVRLDLAGLVDEVLESAPPPDGITVTTPDPGVALDADKEMMVRVFINLVTNAYQAMPGGGSLTIAGSADDGTFDVTVQDTGSGIDASVADRVFDPFVSTKPTGTGLGLAIVKRIIDAHGGVVTAQPGQDGGTRITLRIPRS